MRASILRRWKAVREPRAVDEAVDVCYGSRRFKTDLERLEFLSDPLTQLAEKETRIAEKETRKAKRRRSKQ